MESIRHLSQRTEKGLHCSWIDQHDWKAVSSLLYSSKAADRARGVARVAAWTARGVVPFPVEITADIVSSQLADDSSNQQQQQQSLALLYSMVVTRFINGVTDYGTCRGRRKSSIMEMVAHYGIPGWLVTMRHEGTHKVLPSLASLREGARFAYRWLWTNYWQAQYSLLTAEPPLTQKVAQEKRKSASPSAPSTDTVSSDMLNWLRKELMIFMRTDLSQPIKNILNLKPLAKRLANTDPVSLAELLQEGLLLGTSEEEANVTMPVDLSSLPTLPPPVLRRWSMLLRPMGKHLRIAKTNILLSLLYAVHSTCCSLLRTNLLAAWIGVLVQCSRHEEESSMSLEEPAVISIDISEQGKQSQLVMKGDIQWWSLLEVARQHVGVYTFAIVSICLQQLAAEVTPEVIQFLSKLSALVTVSQRIGVESLPPCCQHPPIAEGMYHHELAAIRKRIEEDRKMRRRTEVCVEMETATTAAAAAASGQEEWTRVEGAWQYCPLGLLPGQTLTPFSLDLPAELDGHAPTVGVAAASSCSHTHQSLAIDVTMTVSEQEEDGSRTMEEQTRDDDMLIHSIRDAVTLL